MPIDPDKNSSSDTDWEFWGKKGRVPRMSTTHGRSSPPPKASDEAPQQSSEAQKAEFQKQSHLDLAHIGGADIDTTYTSDDSIGLGNSRNTAANQNTPPPSLETKNPGRRPSQARDEPESGQASTGEKAGSDADDEGGPGKPKRAKKNAGKGKSVSFAD